MPLLPIISAPVGKSGAVMYSISPSTSISGFSIKAITPSIHSPRLCGGMLVAIPTAIPSEPFTSRLGKREGKTEGCIPVSSKVG